MLCQRFCVQAVAGSHNDLVPAEEISLLLGLLSEVPSQVPKMDRSMCKEFVFLVEYQNHGKDEEWPGNVREDPI